MAHMITKSGEALVIPYCNFSSLNHNCFCFYEESYFIFRKDQRTSIIVHLDRLALESFSTYLKSRRYHAIVTSRSGNNLYFSEYFDESSSIDEKVHG